ncbi:DNA-binding protein [Acidithiobacillus montserratensis]|uniref:DNA-binding protein n=1 Tax=Acidithiobacillus montserratensis TaxID=2729135 RepID=A0ACD5HCA1_9PROT|nr:DNA-binding protein [Acidithiobacillus montserratensis]MBU2748255.1 hypothetical protein [Acidithiobacillus montserratensis]
MGITTTDIHAAADSITAAGQRPTLALVRSALGGGSFTTISEAMKSWKATQQAACVTIREPAPTAVTERLTDLGGEVWAIALDLANTRLAGERKALEATRQEMEQEQREAAAFADQLSAELEAARVLIKQQGEALQRAEAQAEQLAEAKATAQAAQAALAEARARVDGLVVLLEQERAEKKEAQAKAELAIAESAKLTGKLEALKA